MLSVSEQPPGLFVSYARADTARLEPFFRLLRDGPEHIWIDVDAIQAGDDWRMEIDRGLSDCDEIVLFLSDASARSEVARYEVETAAASGTPITPVLIAPLSVAAPEVMSRLHHFDATTGDATAVMRLLSRGRPVDIASSRPTELAAAFRRNGARAIFPAFSEGLVSVSARATKAKLFEAAQASTGRAHPASLLTLNRGLSACLAGEWSVGLEALRAHAAGKGDPQALYFLAIHLARGEMLRSAPLSVADEIIAALDRGAPSAPHALWELARAFADLAFEGARSAKDVAGRLDAYQAHLATAPVSEHYRLFWLMKASLPLLGGYADAYVTTLRRLKGVG